MKEITADDLDCVRRIARARARYNPFTTEDDLYQEGLVGLVQAAQGFDPQKGTHWEAYRQTRVFGSIMDAIRSASPRSRREQRNHRTVAEATCRLEQEHGRPVTLTEIAADLGWTVEDVDTARGSTTFRSLDEPYHSEDGGDGALPQLADESASAEDRFLEQDGVTEGRLWLHRLPQRERIVILALREGTTLREVGAQLGVTESRACQLKSNAIRRIRRGLKLNHAETGAGKESAPALASIAPTPQPRRETMQPKTAKAKTAKTKSTERKTLVKLDKTGIDILRRLHREPATAETLAAELGLSVTDTRGALGGLLAQGLAHSGVNLVLLSTTGAGTLGKGERALLERIVEQASSGMIRSGSWYAENMEEKKGNTAKYAFMLRTKGRLYPAGTNTLTLAGHAEAVKLAQVTATPNGQPVLPPTPPPSATANAPSTPPAAEPLPEPPTETRPTPALRLAAPLPEGITPLHSIRERDQLRSRLKLRLAALSAVDLLETAQAADLAAHLLPDDAQALRPILARHLGDGLANALAEILAIAENRVLYSPAEPDLPPAADEAA